MEHPAPSPVILILINVAIKLPVKFQRTTEITALINLDLCCQLVADGVAAVLDGDDTGPPAAGDDGDGLPRIAAQGEQEGIQLRIVRLNGMDHILFSQLCI